MNHTPHWLLALEQTITSSPLMTGNRVLLLQDGPATYKAMIAAIQSAQNHINMETYILDDDVIGQEFAQALIDKQLGGVQVNLIYDSFGTLNTPRAFFERLNSLGMHLLEYNPINPLFTKKQWALNQRDHRKLLIVDGQTVFLGGINISSVYSGGSIGKIFSLQKKDSVAWRDTDLQLEGPVVAEFQKLFLSTWQRQNGAPLANKDYFPKPIIAGDQAVRAIGSSPDEPYSLIYATLLSAMHRAKKSIYITNAYFVPEPQLLGALKAAAMRGVEVILIFPSATDHSLVFHAGRSYYTQLLRAGVKIYQRQDVILHAKTALIDGVWATIGSTNMDWRSFRHNQEVNAVIVDLEFGEQVKQMFDKDLRASERITLERWNHRGLNLRFSEWFSSLWEYWL
ncbi:MAG: cardiolipin synthase [Cytophagales bacterium]|nr:cardiolipin synthase [Cytophagales bacterium]